MLWKEVAQLNFPNAADDKFVINGCVILNGEPMYQGFRIPQGC